MPVFWVCCQRNQSNSNQYPYQQILMRGCVGHARPQLAMPLFQCAVLDICGPVVEGEGGPGVNLAQWLRNLPKITQEAFWSVRNRIQISQSPCGCPPSPLSLVCIYSRIHHLHAARSGLPLRKNSPCPPSSHRHSWALSA